MKNKKPWALVTWRDSNIYSHTEEEDEWRGLIVIPRENVIKIVPRTGAKRNVRYRLPTADEKTLFTHDKSK